VISSTGITGYSVNYFLDFQYSGLPLRGLIDRIISESAILKRYPFWLTFTIPDQIVAEWMLISINDPGINP
jgi:hypothetical protein